VLHLGWTNIAELLFVNLYFYIFNQQRFRADTATIPALQASPARQTVKKLFFLLNLAVEFRVSDLDLRLAGLYK
jgi:hypothetical protein